MTLLKIEQVIPGGWAVVADTIHTMREGLWGKRPDLPAVSIATLDAPPDILAAIREKNRRLLDNEISLEEFIAPDSPYRRDTFFDDQLWAVLRDVAAKYDPESFIDQAVHMIEKFWSQSAAFLPSDIYERVGPENANACLARLHRAWQEASEPESEGLLELLVTDLSYGGKEKWVTDLNEELKAFVFDCVARWA